MYKFEYRAKLLRKHLGLTYGEIANSLGATKKELQNWFRDKDNIPEDKVPVISDYFKLLESELFEEVTVDVSYALLSDLVNDLSNAVSSYEKNGDAEDLMEDIKQIQESVKEVLMKKQDEMKIR